VCGTNRVGTDLHAFEIRGRAHGLELGARRLLDVELNAHAREGRQDIGEEDATVHAVSLREGGGGG